MAPDYLPDTARVWLFSANRPLSADEADALSLHLTAFVSAWTAHDKQLSAGFEIAYNNVVIVAVDEAAEVPSGCSIDKVFRLMQDFGQSHQIDFFQRTRIIKPSVDGVQNLSRAEAEKDFEQGTLQASDSIVNTLVEKLGSRKSNALIPFSQSWIYQQIRSKGSVE